MSEAALQCYRIYLKWELTTAVSMKIIFTCIFNYYPLQEYIDPLRN